MNKIWLAALLLLSGQAMAQSYTYEFKNLGTLESIHFNFDSSTPQNLFVSDQGLGFAGPMFFNFYFTEQPLNIVFDLVTIDPIVDGQGYLPRSSPLFIHDGGYVEAAFLPAINDECGDCDRGSWPVGSTLLKSITYEYADTPAVPEPETYAMLLTGLGVMAFVYQRRRATQLV